MSIEEIRKEFIKLGDDIDRREKELAPLKETYEALSKVIAYFDGKVTKKGLTHEKTSKVYFKEWVKDFLINRGMAMTGNDLRDAYNKEFGSSLSQATFAAKLSTLKEKGVISLAIDTVGADKYLWALPQWMDDKNLKVQYVDLGF